MLVVYILWGTLFVLLHRPLRAAATIAESAPEIYYIINYLSSQGIIFSSAIMQRKSEIYQKEKNENDRKKTEKSPELRDDAGHDDRYDPALDPAHICGLRGRHRMSVLRRLPIRRLALRLRTPLLRKLGGERLLRKAPLRGMRSSIPRG